jgi:hypothetical protein
MTARTRDKNNNTGMCKIAMYTPFSMDCQKSLSLKTRLKLMNPAYFMGPMPFQRVRLIQRESINGTRLKMANEI